MISRLSTSCSNIMIYNFDKCSETKDFRWMVIGWDGFDEVEFDEIEAEKNWHDIYDEYAILSDDNKTILYYRTLIELNNLKAAFYVTGELIRLLPTLRSEESMNLFLDELAAYKFKTNRKDSFSSQIKQAEQMHRFFNNKVGLKQNELDLLKGDDVEKVPLMKQVVRLERALKRDLIDPKTTSVEKWQFLMDELKQAS